MGTLSWRDTVGGLGINCVSVKPHCAAAAAGCILGTTALDTQGGKGERCLAFCSVSQTVPFSSTRSTMHTVVAGL